MKDPRTDTAWFHIQRPAALLSLPSLSFVSTCQPLGGNQRETDLGMEETSESECSLSKLKISPRHSPPPLLSLSLLAPYRCLSYFVSSSES